MKAGQGDQTPARGWWGTDTESDKVGRMLDSR